MLCFYHNDADGRCAARWVALSAGADDPYALESGHFEEMDYSKPFPFELVRKDEKVYIVDFSISPDEMRNLLEITKDVTWIDHHVTAIERFENFEHDIRGVRMVGVAGCMLTYCYLHHMTDRGNGPIKPFTNSMCSDAPYYTKLIADWDVWRFEYGDDTRYFMTAFNAEDTHPFSRFWDRFYDESFGNIPANKMIDDGSIMLKYRDGFMKEYTSLGFDVEFEGHHCFAMNIGHANSEFFKSLPIGRYDIFMPFVFNGEKWIVSLYSRTVDVSEIAKKYGGGGHKGASGFVCMQLPFSKNN